MHKELLRTVATVLNSLKRTCPTCYMNLEAELLVAVAKYQVKEHNKHATRK